MEEKKITAAQISADSKAEVPKLVASSQAIAYFLKALTVR